MKLREKLLIGASVTLLVVLIILLFIWIFSFEGKREDIPSIINDEYVENLYQSILVDEDYTHYSYYNGFFSKYNNLAVEYISNMAYNYIKNKNELNINLAKNELPNALLAEITDLDQIIPKYKIDLETFNKAIKYLYGEDVKIKNESFNIDAKTKAYYTPEENCIYIYEVNENVESPYYVYREKESYEVRDNKETLIIYDRFIKCNKSNGQCYNDEKMSNPNHSITYSNGKLQGSLSNLVRYKHTFKLSGDHFIWQNSDLIDK